MRWTYIRCSLNFTFDLDRLTQFAIFDHSDGRSRFSQPHLVVVEDVHIPGIPNSMGRSSKSLKLIGNRSFGASTSRLAFLSKIRLMSPSSLNSTRRKLFSNMTLNVGTCDLELCNLRSFLQSNHTIRCEVRPHPPKSLYQLVEQGQVPRHE